MRSRFMWAKIKSLSLRYGHPFTQSVVLYPALLAGATGILLATTGYSPTIIGTISAISMGGFYLSAKAIQYVTTLANEVRATIQHVNTLLDTANARANEVENLLDNINKTANEVQVLVKNLNDTVAPELTANIDHATQEAQTLIRMLHETTIPTLTARFENVANTAQNAMDDIAEATGNFSRGGLQLNLGSTAFSQSVEAPTARARRRNRSNEQTNTIHPVEIEQEKCETNSARLN